MKEAISTARSRRTWWRVPATLAGLAAVALLVVHFRTSGKQAGTQTSPTFDVQKGPLTISVSQAGTIRSIKQEILSSRVEGQTTIIYLSEEGSRVTNGQLLVQLDDSTLQDELVEQQIRVQNAESAYIRARETLQVVKIQSESDIFSADLNYRFAQEDLKEYVEGEHKQETRQADSRITLAEETLQLAARKLEWSEKLFKENYISQTERDGDALAHKRATMDVDLARTAKVLLEDYTYTRKVDKLQSNIPQTKRWLERTKLKAYADTVQAEADLKAREAEWRKQQEREGKIKDQIAKTRLVAPQDGLVVYATSVRGTGWRDSREPLAVGQTVRERQEIIYLPTADQMMAEILVHESNLDKLRLGLPVVVTVDALQGRTLLGKVTRIAPLPDAVNMWMNPDLKVYRTEVELEGRQPDLRTGMSCMTDIIVDRYEDAVFVPVQAVLRIGDRPMVYLKKGTEFTPVPVEVGLDNNRMIRILSGVEPGQTVLLTPPLQEAATSMDKGPGNGAVDRARVRTMIDQAGPRPATAEAPQAPGIEEGPPSERTGGRANMTPEQREALRKRLEAMTPEQRQEYMSRRGSRRRSESGGESRPRDGSGGREGGGGSQ